MKKHVSITVHGKVQKVGFRFSAVDKALEWNLTGIVKNYEGDKVQIEVEGELDDLQKFLKWCHVGPEGAEIKKVDYVSTEDLENYETFQAEWFS
jgi:acylphosphatase